MRSKDTKILLIIAQRNCKLISFLWFSVALYGESVAPPFLCRLMPVRRWGVGDVECCQLWVRIRVAMTG